MDKLDLPAVMESVKHGREMAVPPKHWRDTNVRIEGPLVKFLQAAFAESWLETTGIAIGGEDYFPPCRSRWECHRTNREEFADGR
jgi:phosphatidylserine/phosphatidylglycerophosphate/cardiolipin synthase-like enzyme